MATTSNDQTGPANEEDKQREGRDPEVTLTGRKVTSDPQRQRLLPLNNTTSGRWAGRDPEVTTLKNPSNTCRSDGFSWSVHVPNLLREILNNPGTSMLLRPLQIFGAYLYQVGERAAAIDDPELNMLMCRLTMYSCADPDSPHYDREKLNKVLNPESGAPYGRREGDRADRPAPDLKLAKMAAARQDIPTTVSDPLTDFVKCWVSQHGRQAGARGEADVLSRAKGTTLQELFDADILEEYDYVIPALMTKHPGVRVTSRVHVLDMVVEVACPQP